MNIDELLKRKTILVTGGSGFLGKYLIERLLQFDCKVRTIARNEGLLVELKNTFPQIETYCGDISDKVSVAHACQGVNGLFHLAAFKHVTLAELFPMECVKSNIIGSLNLLEQTKEQKMDFSLFVSSDKAYSLKGTYSVTKFLMENLVKEFSDLNLATNYKIIRFGNLLYSTGSVLCLWKENLQKGWPIKLTDPEAIRYFCSKELAVDSMFKLLTSKDFELTPKVKYIKMGNLLEAMVNKYSTKDKPVIQVTGLQAGENLAENIGQSNCDEYTQEEISKLI